MTSNLKRHAAIAALLASVIVAHAVPAVAQTGTTPLFRIVRPRDEV